MTTRTRLLPARALALLVLLLAGCNQSADTTSAHQPEPAAANEALAPATQTPAPTVTEQPPAVPMEEDTHHAEHDHEPVGAPAGEMSESMTVHMVDIAFEPDTVTIPAGADVALIVTNDGLIEHDLDLPEADLHVHAQPGETGKATLRLNEPGTYQARCLIPGHAEAGMVLTITAR